MGIVYSGERAPRRERTRNAAGSQGDAALFQGSGTDMPSRMAGFLKCQHDGVRLECEECICAECTCVPPCFAADVDGAVAVKWKGLSCDDRLELQHKKLLNLCENRFMCTHNCKLVVSQCENCLGSPEWSKGCLTEGLCLSICHRVLGEIDEDEQAEAVRWMSKNMKSRFVSTNMAAVVIAQFEPAAAANVLMKIKAQNQRSLQHLLAFACAFHPRLGQESCVRMLDGELFRKLALDHILVDDVSEKLLSRMLMLPTVDEMEIMEALEERMECDDYREMEKRIKKIKMR